MLCERLEMCDPVTNTESCVEQCSEIDDTVGDLGCQRLANEVFRCFEPLSCEELEGRFGEDVCGNVVDDLSQNCRP